LIRFAIFLPAFMLNLSEFHGRAVSLPGGGFMSIPASRRQNIQKIFPQLNQNQSHIHKTTELSMKHSKNSPENYFF